MAYAANTQIIRVDAQEPDSEAIALAAQVIHKGGLVAFPTETVYGLGANALDAGALAHIFEAKERPEHDPLIVHIWQSKQLEQIAIDIPEMAYQLADAFWPGPLTLILKKHPNIPRIVTAGNDTVAVRMPAHPIAQALLRQANVPIAAPSANRFSRPSPTTAQHVLGDLEGRVDLVLDGGSTQIGLESTILDITAPIPIVLRPGGLTLEALRPYLPTIAFRPQYIPEDTAAPAPGTLLKHYSPHAELRLFDGEASQVDLAMYEHAQNSLAQQQKVGILARDDEEASKFSGLDVQIVLIGDKHEEMAAALFAGLRTLDTLQVDLILVRAPQQTGLGLALYDRMLRAAEGQIIHTN